MTRLPDYPTTPFVSLCELCEFFGEVFTPLRPVRLALTPAPELDRRIAPGRTAFRSALRPARRPDPVRYAPAGSLREGLPHARRAPSVSAHRSEALCPEA